MEDITEEKMYDNQERFFQTGSVHPKLPPCPLPVDELVQGFLMSTVSGYAMGAAARPIGYRAPLAPYAIGETQERVVLFNTLFGRIFN